jgi:hypothetical protein
MQRHKHGGSAMIAGATTGLIAMAFHPTGHDVMRDTASQGAVTLACTRIKESE